MARKHQCLLLSYSESRYTQGFPQCTPLLFQKYLPHPQMARKQVNASRIITNSLTNDPISTCWDCTVVHDTKSALASLSSLTVTELRLRVSISHRLYLQMELVLLVLVHTLQDPQLSLRKHPTHCPHRFRLVRLIFLRGEGHSPDVVLPGLSLRGGGGDGGGSCFVDVNSVARAGLRMYPTCCTTDERPVFGGHGGFGR